MVQENDFLSVFAKVHFTDGTFCLAAFVLKHLSLGNNEVYRLYPHTEIITLENPLKNTKELYNKNHIALSK